jgi:hypothetical protein
MTAFQKGSVTASGHKMLRETYGEDVWKQVLDRLDEDDRRIVANVAMVTQYPLVTEGRVFALLHEIAFAGDRGRLDREFRAMGRKQADIMLDGIFSIFARMLSPHQAFSRAGSLIAAAYTGVTSDTEPAASGNGGVIHIRGLAEVTHLAPWLCGWMERALERFGASRAKVRERSWDAGNDASDDLAFVISWE